MKRLSTKQKLTIWIALLMLLSVALVLGILMFISNSVIMNHTMEQRQYLTRKAGVEFRKRTESLDLKRDFPL